MDQGENSVVRIPGDQVGFYEWQFEDESSQYKSFFKVIPFSEQELEKALQAGTPVEILY